MDTLGPNTIGDEKLHWLYRHWRAKGRERAAALAKAPSAETDETGRSIEASAACGSQPAWLLPRRDQIDPLELRPGILPHILLAELVAVGASSDGGFTTEPTVAEVGRSQIDRSQPDVTAAYSRWRFRLVGTTVAQTAGFDPTWHYLDEALLGTYGDYVLGLYETLRRNRKPVYSESTYRAPHNARSVERATFRLMLPLAGVAGPPETEGLQRLEAKRADLYEIIVGDDPTPARSEHLLTGVGDLTGAGDPVRFVLSGQVFIDHTTSEKRGVLDEGPFDQGLSVFIEGD